MEGFHFTNDDDDDDDNDDDLYRVDTCSRCNSMLSALSWEFSPQRNNNSKRKKRKKKRHWCLQV